MGPVTKLLLVLALVVPIGAYVAGSLSAPGREEPADRGPVILRDAPTTPNETASPSPNRDDEELRDGRGERDDLDDGDDRDDQDDRNDRDDRDDARVVKPQPTPVGEDDDDGDDDDGPDDDTETERDDDSDDD